MLKKEKKKEDKIEETVGVKIYNFLKKGLINEKIM